MPELQHCARGHSWPHAEGPPQCPICGTAAVVQLAGSPSATEPVGATLDFEPPPRADHSVGSTLPDLSSPYRQAPSAVAEETVALTDAPAPAAAVAPTLEHHIREDAPTPELPSLSRPGGATLSTPDAPIVGVKTLRAPTCPGARPVVRPAVKDYEILDELGRGGMGVVYKARQKGLIASSP